MTRPTSQLNQRAILHHSPPPSIYISLSLAPSSIPRPTTTPTIYLSTQLHPPTVISTHTTTPAYIILHPLHITRPQAQRCVQSSIHATSLSSGGGGCVCEKIIYYEPTSSRISSIPTGHCPQLY
mmetsp:Transcript_2298/g.4264  ORF Transcript_2298/g.4264 Transcript_2298/m.4264 type:complete len:124 (+) Transcript_2298:90-461(+)